MRWSTTFKKEEIEGGDGRSMLRSAAFLKKEKPRERGLSKGGKQRGDRGQESCRRSCGRRERAKTEETEARRAADNCAVVEKGQKRGDRGHESFRRSFLPSSLLSWCSLPSSSLLSSSSKRSILPLDVANVPLVSEEYPDCDMVSFVISTHLTIFL